MRSVTLLPASLLRRGAGAAAFIAFVGQYCREHRQERAAHVGFGRRHAALRLAGVDRPAGLRHPERQLQAEPHGRRPPVSGMGQRADAACDLLRSARPRHPRLFRCEASRPCGVARLRAAVAGPCLDAVRTGEGRRHGEHERHRIGADPGGRTGDGAAARADERSCRDPADADRAGLRPAGLRSDLPMASRPTRNPVMRSPAMVNRHTVRLMRARPITGSPIRVSLTLNRPFRRSRRRPITADPTERAVTLPQAIME